jgi:RNA polymerase sigma-70 factor (ECF subfamily)
MDSAGDQDRQAAFKRLYQEHYRAIAAYALRRLSAEDADDLIAETFLVAWRRLEDIPDGDLTRPWLYAVARRTLSQRARSGRRRDRLVARLKAVRQPEDADGIESERIDDQELVRTALARLRPEDQELLRLAEWEELGRAELARAFECSANAVAIRLHRAHRRFSRALDAMEREAPAAERREVTT